MEWLSSIRTAINYMEEHLTDDISAQDVAARVHLSPFFLQRGFSLMTGYGIGEYIRNRRLYQAAVDLKGTIIKRGESAVNFWVRNHDFGGKMLGHTASTPLVAFGHTAKVAQNGKFVFFCLSFWK